MSRAAKATASGYGVQNRDLRDNRVLCYIDGTGNLYNPDFYNNRGFGWSCDE